LQFNYILFKENAANELIKLLEFNLFKVFKNNLIYLIINLLIQNLENNLN